MRDVPRSGLLPFPAWVPSAARRAIEDLWEDRSLDEAARATLIRLATYPDMHTVWEKLPGEPENAAGDVIQCAMIAVMAFPMLRPMPQTERREAWDRWAQYRRKRPLGLTDESHSWSAAELRDAIGKISEASWSHHWQGDPATDRAHVVSILDNVARTYQSMFAEKVRHCWPRCNFRQSTAGMTPARRNGSSANGCLAG